MSSVIRFTANGPSFGQADLNNCEREKIHLPGSIQPHGALLVVDDKHFKITRLSENAASLLGLDESEALLGCSVSKISADLEQQLKAAVESRNLHLPSSMSFTTKVNLDCVVHRAPSGELVLEFETATHIATGLTSELHTGIEKIKEAASFQSLCDIAVSMFKELFDYDRVIVYRFATDGHGEVFSELCNAEMEPYLGNHYPASDIPNVARELYKRNHVRMLADVNYEPAVLRPKPSVGEAEPLDMSLCHLRSMSPMHIQYVKNMGVQATLVISLVAGNTLWGLISCSQSTPKKIGYEQRLLAELLGEIISTRISALESLAQTKSESAVQQLEKSMIEAISSEGDWTIALKRSSNKLLQPLDSIGAVLITKDATIHAGATPCEEDIARLLLWLDKQNLKAVFCTTSIAKDYPNFSGMFKDFPGVVAVPVSKLGGEYIIWFRPEHVRTICWGGKPEKLADDDGNTLELSPRSSFDRWTELLENTANNWSNAAISAARLIGASIADVMQQFRAMRVMIAHNQLESLSNQIIDSDLPALIANSSGSIVLVNRAFDDLMWNESTPSHHLSNLPRLFQESALASYNLKQLVEEQESWRGSATLDDKPVLIRADAVFSAPGKVMGYVMLVTDISDRQMAENAKRRFPQRSLKQLAQSSIPMDGKIGEVFENLLSIVLENAQLAAMEITDGIDAKRIPTMLAGVEASVSRTSRLITELVKHSKADNK